MRIGILGGTFNPIHNGHVYIAEKAFKELELDKLLFIPSYLPPHREVDNEVSPEDRLTMTKMVTDVFPYFELCSYEIEKGDVSYTIDTVRYLKDTLGGSEFFFIVGEDWEGEISTWKDYEELQKLVKFIVFPRIDVSSSMIRKKIENEESIDELVPPQVHGYIQAKGLYID